MDQLLLRATEKALSKCYTPYASRINDDYKCHILEYMMNPSEPFWDRIMGTLIKDHVTLWQAVIRKDPTFPRTGRRYECDTNRVIKKWERIPAPKLLLEAINYVLTEENS
jgi:hypothetical protein